MQPAIASLRNVPRASAAAALALATLALAAMPASAQDLAARILKEGSENSQVMRYQDALCHDIGSRLTGSRGFDRAADWAIAEFEKMGLEAKLSPWGEWKVGWDRGQWMGRMVAPKGLELQVACPAWTEGTRGIQRGTLVHMPTDQAGLDALQAMLDDDGAAGTSHWLYGALPRGELGNATRELFEREDVIGIVQSASSTNWNSKDYPNQIRVFGSRTAPLLAYDQRQRWPQAVVRDDQAIQLNEALKGDEPVVVEFELRNRWRQGPVALNNVVADLVGTEFPDEYVIICAHLDSWHQATGATDNGTGTCSTLECARILTKLGFRPKRTIRFILWSGEEQGLLGSRQYVVQNRTRMHKVSAVFNHDSGTNWAYSLSIAASHEEDFAEIIKPIVEGMKPPEASHQGDVFAVRPTAVMRPAGGGSDHASFAAVGVPAFSWRLKGPVPYGRGWHSQWDTYSIVRPDFQKHNATVFAVVAAGIANLDHMLSRTGVERATPGGRRSRVNAQLIVETWLGVEIDGTKLTTVVNDGLGAKNRLLAGDAFASVDGTEVANSRDLLAALRSGNSENGAVDVVVRRDGADVKLRLKL